MKTAVAALLLVALAFQVAAKPVPKIAPKTDDKELLQGVWELTHYKLDGKELQRRSTLTVKGDIWTNGPIIAGSKNAIKFKIDQSKTPKTLDLITLVDGVEGPRVQQIYKLDGDVLIIRRTGNVRPTNFEGQAGIFTVWKRVAAPK